jgi:rare lipoprotein A
MTALAATRLIVVVLLASCRREPDVRAPDWGVTPPPYPEAPVPSAQPAERPPLAAEPEPAPARAEPLEQRYAQAPAVRVLEGKAAYYSDALAGRPTASGEKYDPAQLTAAHRSLPFGSVVRVVRRDTGAVVYVRITDRGPFGDASRIIDLSRAAAEQLDMLRAGVVPVRAEVVELPER